MIAQSYDYPFNGSLSETTATLSDGRLVNIDIRYNQVMACGVGSGGSVADLDAAALIAEARVHGKFGYEPVAKVAFVPLAESSASKRFERWMDSGEGDL